VSTANASEVGTSPSATLPAGDPRGPWPLPGAGDTGGLGIPTPEPITSLPPLEDTFHGVPVSRNTGQPRRHPLMIVANAFLYGAAAAGAVSYASCWWYAIHMATFANSSRAVQLMDPRPGSLKSIIAVVMMTVAALVVVAAPAITAFNSWNGHRWSRRSVIASFVLSFLGYFLNKIAWVGPPLIAIGAVFLWLPAVGEYFHRWEQFRTPDKPLAEPMGDVVYGPLPRYR